MTPPTKKLLRRTPALLAAGLAAVLSFTGTASACPLVGHAHRTVTTADGETFHLGLTADSTHLPAAGATVGVRGEGYNRAQGIFLAFCVIPDGVEVGDPATYTQLPGPCLGGRQSTDGSARRITDQGTGTPGVTIPYEEGGRFTTTLDIKPEISDGVDCDVTVRCAIVTRADFTATDNRLYDQYIPVHFAPTGKG